MRKIIKNNKGVSEVVSYALSLGIMALLIGGIYVTVNAAIEDKLSTSGSVVAENIADHIADGVLNTIYIKENHPNSDYKVDLKIPLKISGKDYYIKLTNDKVFVNTTDGTISEYSTFFNVSKRACLDISSEEIYGSQQYVTIYSKKSDYVYKFDFGGFNDGAPWEKFDGYIRITNTSNDNVPGYDILNVLGFHNCTPIKIVNPTDETIEYYPVLIQLDPANFNIFTASENGSEICFYDEYTHELDFWVERWNPWNTSTTRIWVELEVIPPEGLYIYMYHGKPGGASASNGENTFIFFEDFNEDSLSQIDQEWDFSPANEPYLEDGKLVLDSRKGGGNVDCYAEVQQLDLLDGIIEARVTCTGNQRDCSLFARKNGSYRYIFHSGKYDTPAGFLYPEWGDYFDCSISVKCSNGKTPHEQCPKIYLRSSSVSKDWNRLVLVLNQNDLAGARYYYDNYELNGFVDYNDSEDVFMDNHSNGGSFGIINQMGNKSYVDWFFVRPYIGKDDFESDPGDNYKDRYPYAVVDGTISEYFNWSDTSNLKTTSKGSGVKDDLSRDCVYSTTVDGEFLISNLKPSTEYSFVYTVGDFFDDPGDPDIGMQIRAVGLNNEIKKTINNVGKGNFTTGWFTAFTDNSGEISISFEGLGGYWSICSLTVEEGVRIVEAR